MARRRRSPGRSARSAAAVAWAAGHAGAAEAEDRVHGPAAEDEPRGNLRLHASGERLGALLKERVRLLGHVERKKRRLEKATGRAEESVRTFVEQIRPMVAEQAKVVAELRALFDELLAPGRLSARARNEVRQVQEMLEERGVLEKVEASPSAGSEGGTGPDGSDENWSAEDPSEFDDPWGFDDSEGFDAARGATGAGGADRTGRRRPREVDPAAQRGQGAGRESLRALFKRLARMVHPDRAMQELDRQRRTEAMKQITQAYEDGDLARLIQLEQSWQADGPLPDLVDDEVRCRQLEREIRELGTQAKELERQARRLDRERRKGVPPFHMPLEDVVAQAQVELDEVKKVCDFVKGFRDGKITLARFKKGPMAEDDDLGVDLELLFDIIDEQLSESATRVRRKRSSPKVPKQRKARW